MATITERILAAVQAGAADDAELAAALGLSHQAVNQTARKLETQGRLLRSIGAAGKIVQLPARAPGAHPAPPARTSPPLGLTARRLTSSLLVPVVRRRKTAQARR